MAPDRMISRIEQRCIDKGMKMTDQRRVIARVLSESADHPDVEEVHRRATEIDSRISIATVYRTVRLFEEANILERHDFGDGRARYEKVPDEHHDHLIDITTGRVIEFHSPEIEALQGEIARRFGFRLKGHRLELYGVPLPESGGGAGSGAAPGAGGVDREGGVVGGEDADGDHPAGPEPERPPERDSQRAAGSGAGDPGCDGGTDGVPGEDV